MGEHKEYTAIMELTLLIVGANNELLKCVKQINEVKVQNFCAPRRLSGISNRQVQPTFVARERG